MNTYRKNEKFVIMPNGKEITIPTLKYSLKIDFIIKYGNFLLVTKE